MRKEIEDYVEGKEEKEEKEKLEMKVEKLDSLFTFLLCFFIS